jgi:hypothetical protein
LSDETNFQRPEEEIPKPHLEEVRKLRKLIGRVEDELREATRMLFLAAVVCENSGFPSSGTMARDMVERLRRLADQLEAEAAPARLEDDF